MQQNIGHFIIGLRGKMLANEERQWLKEAPPLGVILFTRNIENPEQVKSLLDDVRACTGEATWAAIDEEGGRVNRIPWPPFSERRSAAEYGQRMQHNPELAKQAVYADSLSAGRALKSLGFTHNCAPVLDVFHPDGHGIIGERSYAGDVNTVGELGKLCMQGLSDAGIEAVGKHFPGHGRANADSHIAAPFWIKDVLKRQFGFTGHVWSDDLCMQGVGDNLMEAAGKAYDAGCDILLACNPRGMEDIYNAL